MTAKRPSGPTQPETDRRAKVVVVRLTPEQRDRLDVFAASCGLTRSAAVVWLLDRVDRLQ